MIKSCQFCENQFKAKNKNHKYCSKVCQTNYNKYKDLIDPPFDKRKVLLYIWKQNKYNFTKTGDILGITDNAVKKTIKVYFPEAFKEYEAYKEKRIKDRTYTCKVCGEVFFDKTRNRKRTYCSRQCYNKDVLISQKSIKKAKDLLKKGLTLREVSDLTDINRINITQYKKEIQGKKDIRCKQCGMKTRNIRNHTCKYCKECNSLIKKNYLDKEAPKYCSNICIQKAREKDKNKEKDVVIYKNRKKILRKKQSKYRPLRQKSLRKKRSKLKVRTFCEICDTKFIKKKRQSLNCCSKKCKQIRIKRKERNRIKLLKNRAKKYDKLGQFIKEEKQLYEFALKMNKKYKGFFNNITKNMDRLGNKYYRCIYVILFEEKNEAYIGLIPIPFSFMGLVPKSTLLAK